MDATRGLGTTAIKGQGRPFIAGPSNNDGAREPDEVGPDARGKNFCLLLAGPAIRAFAKSDPP
jgi:hypothetical protein